MRNAFIEELVRLAERNPKVALVVGDLGFSVVEPFANKFPDRFINAGVAEQNMTGLAAGMASEGFQVFTYSIANFPTFRCAEQIRNDVAYHNLPVTVVSVGGGLAYGALGYSHHAVQDYGLMRVFPNMQIFAPGDPAEVRASMRYLGQNPGPSYLRLGKAGEKVFHQEIPVLSPGQWLCVRKSSSFKSKKTILTTGATLGVAMNLVALNKSFEDFDVHTLPIWGIASKDVQQKFVDRYESVVTLEDHLKDAGFGSWLMESLRPESVSKIRVNALDASVCGLVGQQAVLNNAGGLGAL